MGNAGIVLFSCGNAGQKSVCPGIMAGQDVLFLWLSGVGRFYNVF